LSRLERQGQRPDVHDFLALSSSLPPTSWRLPC